MRNFNHTVDVLVKAYFKGELEHGDCAKCAVGNIIHEATGLEVGDPEADINGTCGVWKSLFVTIQGKQTFYPSELSEFKEEAIDAVCKTGYTIKELASIEFAFETAWGNSMDELMFNGLMAVVDVLAEIHGIDLTAKEQAKALFVKV